MWELALFFTVLAVVVVKLVIPGVKELRQERKRLEDAQAVSAQQARAALGVVARLLLGWLNQPLTTAGEVSREGAGDQEVMRWSFEDERGWVRLELHVASWLKRRDEALAQWSRSQNLLAERELALPIALDWRLPHLPLPAPLSVIAGELRYRGLRLVGEEQALFKLLMGEQVISGPPGLEDVRLSVEGGALMMTGQLLVSPTPALTPHAVQRALSWWSLLISELRVPDEQDDARCAMQWLLEMSPASPLFGQLLAQVRALDEGALEPLWFKHRLEALRGHQASYRGLVQYQPSALWSMHVDDQASLIEVQRTRGLDASLIWLTNAGLEALWAKTQLSIKTRALLLEALLLRDAGVGVSRLSEVLGQQDEASRSALWEVVARHPSPEVWGLLRQWPLSAHGEGAQASWLGALNQLVATQLSRHPEQQAWVEAQLCEALLSVRDERALMTALTLLQHTPTMRALGPLGELVKRSGLGETARVRAQSVLLWLQSRYVGVEATGGLSLAREVDASGKLSLSEPGGALSEAPERASSE